MKTFHSFLTIFATLMIALSSSCNSKSVNKEKEENQLLRVQIGEKYGFINQNGRIIIEPQFDDANPTFIEDVCSARIGDQYGLIDKNGNFILTFNEKIRGASNLKNGFSRVRLVDDSYNIINKEGVFILDSDQNNVWIIEDEIDEETYFVVPGERNNKDWYVYNSTGIIIGEPYDSIISFSNGLCPVKLNNKWGYIDKSGNLIIDTIFHKAWIFSEEGIARVRKDSSEFYIDMNGNKLIEFYKTLTGFECNRAAISEHEKKYLIDISGKKIKEIKADEIKPFSKNDSLATIINNKVASKVDINGSIILSTKYENIGDFVNGLASVSKNGKYGYIDKTGKEIIKVSFDDIATIFETEESKVRAMLTDKNSYWEISYFDLEGNFIGKDMPTYKVHLPIKPTKDDLIAYFDDRLSELDPIEGIYYVTKEDYYQHRINPDINGINNSESAFFAIIRDQLTGDFVARCVDRSDNWWVNKFVKIGDSKNYAIVQNDNILTGNEKKYSSEGKFTLEDAYKFAFRLERGSINPYNFFVIYEFEKDYPPVAEYEKIQQAEWTGSGFAIANGYIATNYHVTSGAKSIRIKGIEGNFKKSYKAVVVANDKHNDISILKIVDKNYDGIGTIPYKIGKTMVDVGENIFVLGYPKIDTMGDEIKVTEGIISSSTGFQGNSSMYQISAAVQPGNSGGPLFDDEGTIIGIVCAKHADAENANYAVKIANLFSLINSSNLGIKVADNNVGEKKVSGIVKKVKNYVYLIECNSH